MKIRNYRFAKRPLDRARAGTLASIACLLGCLFAGGCIQINADVGTALDIPTFVEDVARNVIAALAT